MKSSKKLNKNSFRIIESGLSADQLSHIELATVIGGACGGDACGGNACGIQLCPVDVCAVDACIVDLFINGAYQKFKPDTIKSELINLNDSFPIQVYALN